VPQFELHPKRFGFGDMCENSLMKQPVYTVFLFFAFGLSIGPVYSQRSEQYAEEIEKTLEILQQQRLEIIRQTLPLTTGEASRFWPLYEEYDAKLRKIGDREVKLITLYSIVREHFAIVKVKNELQSEYFPRFKQILPVIKAARFFQIENKIETLNRGDMARKIPLFEAPR